MFLGVYTHTNSLLHHIHICGIRANEDTHTVYRSGACILFGYDYHIHLLLPGSLNLRVLEVLYTLYFTESEVRAWSCATMIRSSKVRFNSHSSRDTEAMLFCIPMLSAIIHVAVYHRRSIYK